MIEHDNKRAKDGLLVLSNSARIWFVNGFS